MKGYNGVATLSRQEPRVLFTVYIRVRTMRASEFSRLRWMAYRLSTPTIPQGYSISSDKYAFKLAWLARIRRYFETQLDPRYRRSGLAI